MVTLVRELVAVAPEGEPRADCAHCPMDRARSGADPRFPWAFDPEIHCCTYHPYLPNFLVGQALQRGGTSERVVRARMEEPEGVGPLGIWPTMARHERYEASPTSFGRDRSLRCPYWVPGDLGCGIWRDRGHVCRTWFCRSDRGHAGHLWWRRLSTGLKAAEHLIAYFCAKQGARPVRGAPLAEWVDFYTWCADRVRAMTPAEIEGLRSAELVEGLQAVGEPPEIGPIPDIVIPSVSVVERQDGMVWVSGGMAYDVLHLPASVFVLFSKLDGHTPWRAALAATNAEIDEPLPEDVVLELYRVGGVHSPEPGDLRGDEARYPDIRQMSEGAFLRITRE